MTRRRAKRIGEVSVLGEGSGHARLRNPRVRHPIFATSALDASEDAHVVGAIVDFAKEAITMVRT
eukprot:scaffold1967_cov60-Phaeocystis_antarctica.AAC.5